jgi:hypothetical protein
MRLRGRALVRRCKQTLSRPKGIILTVVTAMLFVPWVFSVVMQSRAGIRPPIEYVQRFAPLALFLFTVGAIVLTAGEQALYYSPAEVTFLFAGPFRKRQILTYKLVQTALLCLISSAFVVLGTLTFARWPLAAFVGAFVIILWLQLLTMAIGLAGSTLGAIAWSRGRKLALVAVAALVVLAIATAGRDLMALASIAGLEAVEHSPVTFIVLSPFRALVNIYTADNWVDLGLNTILGMALIGVTVGLIFTFDATYLEAASTASARRFAKIKRMMGGGGGLRSTSIRKAGKLRFRPPNPPWWGGAGPNFWRQMTTALGDPGRLTVVVVALSAFPLVLMFIPTPQQTEKAAMLLPLSLGMIAWMSIFLSALIPFDFRGDIDLMEELKSLPIRPAWLVLGQLLTPTLIVTIAQGIAMTVVILALGKVTTPLAWSGLAFLLPINFYFFGVENLLFLWFPSRMVAGQFDVMAIGKQMLLLFGKMFGIAIGAGLAGGLGVGVYYLTGHAIAPALLVAWVIMLVGSLAIVPLVASAFEHFDVSRDTPG